MISELESHRHRSVTWDSRVGVAFEIDCPVENREKPKQKFWIGTIVQKSGCFEI